jgi:hypothetical protein
MYQLFGACQVNYHDFINKACISLKYFFGAVQNLDIIVIYVGKMRLAASL